MEIWVLGFGTRWEAVGIWDLEYGVMGLGNRRLEIWDAEFGIKVVVKIG